MSSKSNHSGAAETSRGASVATSPAIPDLASLQFVRSADWAAAGFRARGALQQVTVQMCQRAALMHLQAADQARKATSPLELLQVQSALMTHQWQEMTRYSQEWMLACTQGVAESVATGVDASTTGATPAAGRIADMGVAPMVQAWQQMFAGLASEAAGAGR